MRQPENPPQRAVRGRLTLPLAWCILALLEGLAALGMVLSQESDTKNTWLFGYSKSRLGVLAGILILVVALTLVAIRFWRNPEKAKNLSGWVKRVLGKRLLYGTLVGFSLGGVVLFSQLYHFSTVVSDPYVEGYLGRLKPGFFWALGLSLQTLLCLPIFRYDLASVKPARARGTIRNSLIILVGFMLLGLVVAITGIGIEPDKVGWDAPGVPVPAFQVGVVWLFGVLYLCLDTLLRARAGVLNRRLSLDVFISVILWVGAFVLWSREPLTPDYFAPQPRAPNFEYYPYSDAALHDVAAQELLIGEGFKGIARKPVYALFLAFSHLVAGQDYERVILIQVALLAFLPVLIFWLAKEMHHRVSGVLAAGLVILREQNAIATSGEIRVSHAKLMMSDLPAALAIVMITWLLVSWLQDPVKRQYRPFAIGGAIGLLMLLRPQFVLLVPAVILLVFVVSFKRPVKGALNLGLMALGGIATLSPWLLRSYHLTGTISLNDPHQMAFLTQQYHLEPGSETLERLPGETEGEYAQRISRYLKDFTLENPGVVAEFISSHFAHNEIEMVMPLPMSAWFVSNPDSDLFPYWRQKWERLWEECCSVHAYIDAAGFWDPIRETLTSEHLIPLVLNLGLVSVGLAVLWKRQDVLGLIPLGVSIFYSLSTAVGRYSGWRLILPADWVVFLYYAVGIGQITLWLREIYTGRSPHATEVKVRETTWDRISKLPRNFTPPARFAIIQGIVILCMGLVPVMVDVMVPQRYPPASKEALLESILLFDEVDIERFLMDDNAVAVEGRALYPRYYRAGDGEPGGGWAAFAPRKFNRLGFFLVGQARGSVIMPMDEPPESFPHASDVILVGCQGEEFIDAAVVVLVTENPDEFEVLIRPSLDLLACPLPAP